MVDKLRRISIALPASLLAYIDAQAKQRGVSRSQVIIEALEEMRRREMDELAAEGYRFYSSESLEFAAVTTEAVAEAWEVPDESLANG